MGQDLFYFFPVRGRKPLRAADHTRLISNNLFYFFPVRGRKPVVFLIISIVPSYLFYFFPVRGRKLFKLSRRLEPLFSKFILFLPRQGTETVYCPKCIVQIVLFILFLPRQGTETHNKTL